MRGVQDTYGVSGYADNRKPYGAYSPAMRLRFPFDARLSCLTGLDIYTSSDSAVCPQTWKPAHPAEQLKLQRLSAVTGVSKGHHGLHTSAPHGPAESYGKAGTTSSRFPIRNVVKLGEKCI